jgi:hypothetical protein
LRRASSTASRCRQASRDSCASGKTATRVVEPAAYRYWTATDDGIFTVDINSERIALYRYALADGAETVLAELPSDDAVALFSAPFAPAGATPAVSYLGLGGGQHDALAQADGALYFPVEVPESIYPPTGQPLVAPVIVAWSPDRGFHLLTKVVREAAGSVLNLRARSGRLYWREGGGCDSGGALSRIRSIPL